MSALPPKELGVEKYASHQTLLRFMCISTLVACDGASNPELMRRKYLAAFVTPRRQVNPGRLRIESDHNFSRNSVAFDAPRNLPLGGAWQPRGPLKSSLVNL
jgi:hypothetical protein